MLQVPPRFFKSLRDALSPSEMLQVPPRFSKSLRDTPSLLKQSLLRLVALRELQAS